MKTIIILLAFLSFGTLLGQDVDKIEIPKGVVYNYGDNRLNEKAKNLIVENLTNTNRYSIVQENLIIGPQLWKRYRDIERLKQIEKGNVAIMCDGVKLTAKMTQDIKDSKAVWDEFRKEIVGNYKIRKANRAELKYYWSVISFDIDEPLLIVETENHNYILNLLKKDMKLLWLDEAPNSNYYNPIENKTYEAEGGFKTYQNGEEVTTTSKGQKETKLEKVILLSSDDELKANSSLEDISTIITESEKLFTELFKTSVKPGKIMIQFELRKENNEIQFAVRDDIDLDIMKVFEERIKNAKFPTSKNDPVKIQLIFKVNSFDD